MCSVLISDSVTPFCQLPLYILQRFFHLSHSLDLMVHTYLTNVYLKLQREICIMPEIGIGIMQGVFNTVLLSYTTVPYSLICTATMQIRQINTSKHYEFTVTIRRSMV